MSFQDQEGGHGGLVRNLPKQRRNRRRTLPYVQPKRDKTWQDKRDEAEAARRRWAGVPPLAAAREMIAEAGLSEEMVAELLPAISQLDTDKLETIINSGELAEILEKFKTSVGASHSF